jgi:hypothetical protein
VSVPGVQAVMEPETGYQGWTNRATWATNLWLTNTEPYYRALQRCKSVVDIQVHASQNDAGSPSLFW